MEAGVPEGLLLGEEQTKTRGGLISVGGQCRTLSCLSIDSAKERNSTGIARISGKTPVTFVTACLRIENYKQQNIFVGDRETGMNQMTTIITILKDESGATAIEYGLIAALVSVAAIAALGTMGSSLKQMFQTVANALQSATN